LKFRWTMKQLKEKSDTQILLGLVNEKLSQLNPFDIDGTAPLAERLTEIIENLRKKIN